MNTTIPVPWDFIGGTDEPTIGGVPNEPSDLGRELGGMVARMTERTGDPILSERCHDCAFRAGTRANGCGATLLDALKCVVEGAGFWCHVNEGRPCAGYVAARRARGQE